MTITYDESFLESLSKIGDQKIKTRVKTIIEQLEVAPSLQDIASLKKLSGFKTFYRIRVGDYRIGLELLPDNSLTLIVIANRKDIYRRFP